MPVAHLRVSGRVQGVGFRWFVRVSARRLGLRGWVTNQRDGTVEIAAEGTAECLAQLRKLVSRGPDSAVVDEVIDLPPVAEELEFPFAMRK